MPRLDPRTANGGLAPGRGGGGNMRHPAIALIAAAALLLLLLAQPAAAHEAEEGSPTGRLGTVDFANSCDAKVQKEFQRAVAMLHSFWFNAGEKTFRHVLAEDPGCAIATFGIPAVLL